MQRWLFGWTLVLALGVPLVHADGPLRLGTNVWPGYEPLYLARELGYLGEGSVRLVEYLSASEVLRAFRNQSLEAAALTLDEVLVLLQNGIPVQIFLVTDVSHGGDVILARPEITRFEQLAGKRVGVEGGALGGYVLSRALDRHGLALDAIDIVHLEVHEHAAAYEAGRVDAVVTFEPVRTRLLAAGAKEVFSSREIPGEIVDVLVVHRRYASSHGDALEHLVQGWFQALVHLEQDPRDAARRMSERLRISPEAVLASYDGLGLPSREENLTLLEGPSASLLPVARRLEQLMLKMQLLSSPVDLNPLLAPHAVKVATQ